MSLVHGLFEYNNVGQASIRICRNFRRNTVWFTTENGQLNKLTPEGRVNQVNILNNIPISHLMVDNKNNLWLKTEPKLFFRKF